MPKSLAWEIVGTTVVLAHNSQPIDAAEFTGFINGLKNHTPTGVMVFTPKHGPSSDQRKALQDIIKVTPVAVLTFSSAARGIVALLNVFTGTQVRAFSPDDLAAAFAHARVVANDHEEVRQTLQRLRAQLGD